MMMWRIGLIVLVFMTSGCEVLFDLFVFPSVSVSEHSLCFDLTLDEEVLSQEVTADCSTIDSYGFNDSCYAELETDDPWIEVEPDSIWGWERVTITVDPEGLEPGLYEGKVKLRYEPFSIDDEEEITIEMIVPEPPEEPSEEPPLEEAV